MALVLVSMTETFTRIIRNMLVHSWNMLSLKLIKSPCVNVSLSSELPLMTKQKSLSRARRSPCHIIPHAQMNIFSRWLFSTQGLTQLKGKAQSIRISRWEHCFPSFSSKYQAGSLKTNQVFACLTEMKCHQPFPLMDVHWRSCCAWAETWCCAWPFAGVGQSMVWEAMKGNRGQHKHTGLQTTYRQDPSDHTSGD